MYNQAVPTLAEGSHPTAFVPEAQLRNLLAVRLRTCRVVAGVRGALDS